MSFQFVRQHDVRDCGAACLSMICRHYGLRLPMARFREYIKVDNNGASLYGLIDGAAQVGLAGTALQGSPEELLDSFRAGEFALPLIARVILDGSLEHYVVIYRITSRAICVADPAKGKKKYGYDEFFKLWTGHIVVYEKTDAFRRGNECKGTLRRFLQLILRQKKLLTAVFFTSLFISLVSVLGAFIFQIIVDGVQKNELDGFLGGRLAVICGAVIGLYLLRAGIAVIRGKLLARLSERVDLPLVLGYYDHVVDLPMKHLTERKTGELMSRFDDASEIRDALSGAALSIMLDTLMVILCVVVLFTLNDKLFYITTLTVLAYAAVVLCFLRPIKRVNEEVMEDNAEVTSYLKESVDGLETVKAFGAERLVKEKAAGKLKKSVRHSVHGAIIYTWQDSLSGLVASVGVVLLLWIGTALVVDGVVTLGALITFYSLLGYFLDPIQRLVNLQPQLQTAVIAAERLNDILDLKTEPDAALSAELGGGIQISHVDFRYGNRELVLRDVTMEIGAGETVALVGESGSGKTTLAKLIMAFYTPEKGAIRIGGKDIAELDARSVRQSIAYISQEVFLFSDTIKNNLTLGNDALSMEEIETACKMSMADEFIQRMPLGYNTVIGENGSDLSGGQKQRLAIARALLKRPKILIMDEATSNLDTITEQSIKRTIDRLHGEITCILIAHRLSTIKSCDTIYVMQNGAVAESGTHASLLSQNGLYKRLYDETR